MSKTICVYCASSDAIAKQYFDAARELGKYIGENGYTLIFGGGKIGLMGELARSVHHFGGKVVGVIPGHLNEYGITYEESDELIVTSTMRERKAIMEEKSDVFIGLPGGFGTLEEILEIITLKQIQLHRKPVILLNTENFYRRLIDLFEHIYEEQFAKSMHRQLYFVAGDVPSAVSYIHSYAPSDIPQKWF
jgi:cytokinin riboside 5'-monophosphate phosphoribohydrolase